MAILAEFDPGFVASCSGILLLAYWIYAYYNRSGLSAFQAAPRMPVLGTLPYIKAGSLPKQVYQWSKSYGPMFTIDLGYSRTMLFLNTAAAYDAGLENDQSLQLRNRVGVISAELQLHDEFLPAEDTSPEVIAKRKAVLAGVRTALASSNPGIDRTVHYMVEGLRERGGKAIDGHELTALMQKCMVLLGISISWGLSWTPSDVEKNKAAMELVHCLTEALGLLGLDDITVIFPHIRFLLFRMVGRKKAQARKLRIRAKAASEELWQIALDQVKREGMDSLEPSTLKSLLSDSDDSMNHHDVLMSVESAQAGSTDTTAHTISSVIACLCAWPEWQGKIRQDQSDDTARAFVREVMRLFNIVSLVDRRSNEPFYLDGKLVPKNTSCVYCVYAINRDPALYGSDAEDFNPARFLNPSLKFHSYQHVSFGIGKRSCPGSALAERVLIRAVKALTTEFDLSFEDGKVGFSALTPTRVGVLNSLKSAPIIARARKES